MRSTIVKENNESGFSLLEMAIVIVLIGIILTPAIALYKNYRMEKDWSETEKKLDTVVKEIGGFRSVYSRYPCPASQTAVSGDVEYGFEDCSINTVGSCTGGICTYANSSGDAVTIGALPFKTLNLQEAESYDPYLSRIKYAITRDLTQSNTFDMNGGAIGIVDKTGVSIIDPAETAHFAIISHGHNKISGFTRAGVQSSTCANATLTEQENCDADSVFLSGEIDNDFDDRIKFFSNVMPSEWSIPATDPNSIYLDKHLAVGVAINTNLTDGKMGTVKNSQSNSGAVRASNEFRSDTICEYDAAGAVDCFAPRLIGGSLNHDGTRLEAETTGGSGMSCYKPSLAEDGFLVGVENGMPICADEIFISCPNGSFVTGIDASGNVLCDAAPEPGCQDMAAITTCGDNRNLVGTNSGGYSQIYSGECRMITDYDYDYFEAQLSGLNFSQIQSFIANLNNEERTIENCGPNPTGSLVRDTYRCDAGDWTHVSAHEKRTYNSQFPSDPYTGGGWPAETSYTGEDISNNNGNHDCWCREDYRAYEVNCPDGFIGMRIHIRKHVCPQTSHWWPLIYTDRTQCVCEPGTVTETQDCNSYYDEVNNVTGDPTTGLSGEVTLTYNVTCVNNQQEQSDTPIVDASDCSCPANDPIIDRNNCDTGTTNSWSWSGGTETGVESLSVSDWICPATTSGGLPDPGYRDDPVPYSPIPACVCDDSATDTVTRDCPSNLQGDGLVYEREWDCATNDWEAEEDWELLSENCNSCVWTAPTSGTATPSQQKMEPRVGTSCACDSNPEKFCWDYGNGDEFSVWQGCQCSVQID